MNEIQLEAFKKMLKEIEAVVKDDNKATINGREYQLSVMTYKQALPFLKLYEKMQLNPHDGVDYELIESMLSNYVLFEGALMKNLPNHFDKYRKDYKTYINTFLMVSIFDFLEEELQVLNGL